MRKANCAAYVSETTPLPCPFLCVSSCSSRRRGDVWCYPVDIIQSAAYSYLRYPTGADDGESKVNTAGPKGRCLVSRWCAQSTSRGRPRSALQRQPVLRSQGSCSGPIRDGAPPSERRHCHQRRSRDLRCLPANFLQGTERVGRPRSHRVSSATTWPKRRPQAIGGSAVIRRGGEGSVPGPHVAASDRHDRPALWTKCPPAKSGARAFTQKK